MRIAQVTDCYLPRLGGIEVQVHDLAMHQIAAGHDVTVLTSTRLPAREEHATGAARVLRMRSPGNRFGPAEPVVQLRNALQAGGFDVVHAHSSVVSPLAWSAVAAAVRLGIPAVLTLHSMLSPRAVALTIADRATGWSQWPVVWTAVSSAAAAPLRTVLGDEVPVVPNGVDVGFWQAFSPRVDRPVVTIASVMRLSRRKRPFALLAILRQIKELAGDRVDLRAVIVGDGPQRASMVRILAARQMDSWVTLTGALDRNQVREVLLRSDVYLAPARRESFGIAALEARSSGLPVIAMASGGVGEFIQDGREGYLVGSDLEMSVVAAQLLSSPRLRSLQEHNRLTRPEMAWPAVVSRTGEIYAQAGARVPPRVPPLVPPRVPGERHPIAAAL